MSGKAVCRAAGTTLALLLAAVAVAAPRPAQLPPDWKVAAPPPLRMKRGPMLAVDGNFGWFSEGEATQEIGAGQGLPGNPMIETRECKRRISLGGIEREVDNILRRAKLTVEYRASGNDQLVIITQPMPKWDQVSFYSYVIRFGGCAETCRLTTAAFKVTAKIDGGRIALSRATKETDHIAALLADAAQSEYDKCSGDSVR